MKKQWTEQNTITQFQEHISIMYRIYINRSGEWRWWRCQRWNVEDGGGNDDSGNSNSNGVGNGDDDTYKDLGERNSKLFLKCLLGRNFTERRSSTDI